MTAELEQETRLSATKIERYLDNALFDVEVVSLDRQVSDHDTRSPADFLESPEPSPLDLLEKQASNDETPRLLDVLTPRERQIVTWRYVDGLTQYKVGEMIGRTHERVQQVEKAALEKMNRVINGHENPNNRFRSEAFCCEYPLVPPESTKKAETNENRVLAPV